MTGETSSRDPYLVKSVVHASRLLSAFRSSGEALPLREIASRSGLPKSMAFRLLYTLERCGMVEKVGENLYRSLVAAVQAETLSARLCGAGHRLPVFERGVDGPRARRRRAGRRAHLRSTTATTRKSPSATPTSSCVKRSIWSSSSRPTSTSRRSSRQVSRGEHPADRDRSASSRRDLLRREQLRGGPDRRAATSADGRSSSCTPRSTKSSSSRSSAPAACRRCG